VEPKGKVVIVFSIFPSRGSRAGGTTLKIYGVNFGTNPMVTMGGKSCPVAATIDASNIKCTIPGGNGLVDVIVSTVNESYTFSNGYRYIDGTGHKIIEK
jgi:IPT/TIG domain